MQIRLFRQQLKMLLFALNATHIHFGIFAVIVCRFGAHKAKALFAFLLHQLPKILLDFQQLLLQDQPHVFLDLLMPLLGTWKFANLLRIKFGVNRHQERRNFLFDQGVGLDEPTIPQGLEFLEHVFGQGHS